MAVKKVVQAGHPALKAENQEIKDFNSPKLKKLIKDLKDTLYKTGLVGIAAPQIGENFMVFVTHARKTNTRKFFKGDILRICINPKIVSFSREKNIIYEGCGSVVHGELFGPVLRPKEIEIEAFDEKGKRFKLRADGILARVIQHEMDHLMATEFIQKVNDYSKVLYQPYYYKNVRNSKEQKEASKITKVEFKLL